jgi:hypothetical protein
MKTTRMLTWATTSIDKYYPEYWHATPGLVEPSAREQLQSYLKRTPADRQNSDPFFAGPNSSEDGMPLLYIDKYIRYKLITLDS